MKKVAILVPAHNEARVINQTLKSLLKLVNKEDLYLVDDASSDNTSKSALRYTKNVLTLAKNLGKAEAMNSAIKKFRLAKRYKYIMPVDADTLISPKFLDYTLTVLEKDKNKELACVIGKVVGVNKKWITTYRLWEYEVAQTIHKAAQSIINAVTVCPGPCTVYRSEIFSKYNYPSGTLTEDMDLTFLIHRKKLGRIEFVPQAFVVTQDPKTLSAFLKQIDRWYTGFWQCLIKHNIPWGGQVLDAEVALLAAEGIFNGLIILTVLALSPFVILKNPTLLLVPLALDFLFFLVPTLGLVSIRHKTLKAFLFIPHFYFLRIISSLVFLKSFLKTVFGLDLKMNTFWNTKRYSLAG